MNYRGVIENTGEERAPQLLLHNVKHNDPRKEMLVQSLCGTLKANRKKWPQAVIKIYQMEEVLIESIKVEQRMVEVEPTKEEKEMVPEGMEVGMAVELQEFLVRCDVRSMSTTEAKL
jgi:hypothetical protein